MRRNRGGVKNLDLYLHDTQSVCIQGCLCRSLFNFDTGELIGQNSGNQARAFSSPAGTHKRATEAYLCLPHPICSSTSPLLPAPLLCTAPWPMQQSAESSSQQAPLHTRLRGTG